MKNNIAALLAAALLALSAAASCASLVSTNDWTKGQHTGLDGNMSDEYFVDYNKETQAIYSTAAGKEERVTIRNLRLKHFTAAVLP